MVTRSAVARARALQQIAQTVSTAGATHASQRAVRLYRRALRLLGSQAPSRPEQSLPALREALRARLAEHGVLHWLRRHRSVLILRGLLLSIVAGLVIAFVPSVHRFVFPPDLAAGKSWRASSAWADFPISGVMSDDPVRVEGRFHTLEEVWPSVVLDLGREATVRKVVVLNRYLYFRERALPLAVELSRDGLQWSRVAYRRAMFDSWSAEFSAQSARYVRLRVDRQSVLHLRHISVY